MKERRTEATYIVEADGPSEAMHNARSAAEAEGFGFPVVTDWSPVDEGDLLYAVAVEEFGF